MITPPMVGFYDMPAENYHAIEAASSTRLKAIRSHSPAHMREAVINPRPQTEAMRLGELVHARVLEPDRWNSDYVVAPVVDRRTTAGKQQWNEFRENNAGKVVVDYDSVVIANGIYDSIMANPILRNVLEAPGYVERSAFWIDPLTNVQCKCRPDKELVEEDSSRLMIVDLKTCDDASPRAFGRSSLSLGYHVQAAFYGDGLKMLNKVNNATFLLVALEKKAPYAHAVYNVNEFAYELGQREYREALNIYAECERLQRWPSYNWDAEAQECLVQDLELPRYAYE